MDTLINTEIWFMDDASQILFEATLTNLRNADAAYGAAYDAEVANGPTRVGVYSWDTARYRAGITFEGAQKAVWAGIHAQVDAGMAIILPKE